MMVMLNYVGPFVSLSVLQTNYPNGGKDGDYADVAGKNYYWVSAKNKWVPEYSTADALNQAQPTAEKGDWAFVGTESPLAIYVYSGTAWENSNNTVDIKPTISAPFIKVDAYNRDKNALSERMETLERESVKKSGSKVLSDENFTKLEKDKLKGIEAGANVYQHPSTHAATMITEDSQHRFSSDTEKGKWNTVEQKMDRREANETYATKVEVGKKVNAEPDKSLMSHQEHDKLSKLELSVKISEVIKANIYVNHGTSDQPGTLCYYRPENKLIWKNNDDKGSLKGNVYFYLSDTDPLAGTRPKQGVLYVCGTDLYFCSKNDLLLQGIAHSTGDNDEIPMTQAAVTQAVNTKVDLKEGYGLISDDDVQKIAEHSEEIKQIKNDAKISFSEFVVAEEVLNKNTDKEGTLVYDSSQNIFLWKVHFADVNDYAYYSIASRNKIVGTEPQIGKVYICNNVPYVGVMNGLTPQIKNVIDDDVVAKVDKNGNPIYHQSKMESVIDPVTKKNLSTLLKEKDTELEKKMEEMQQNIERVFDCGTPESQFGGTRHLDCGRI